MTEQSEKKTVQFRLFVIIFGIVALIGGVLLRSESFIFSSSLEIRGLEVYAQKNEACTADNPPHVRDAWIKEAKLVIDEFKPLDTKSFVDIDEAFPLYCKKGGKSVKDLKKKYVRFPKMENTILGVGKAISVMEKYKKNGVDLAEEIVVDTGLRGTCDFPILLPKHFWEQIQSAAQEADVKEIKIAWGLRDSNLQAIMFVRSTYSKCEAYPSKASAKCIKKVRNNIAGKPSHTGFTHFFSADIDNWEQMQKELVKRDFACGCSGVGEGDDARHVTWNMTPKEASLKCRASMGIKTIKRQIKKIF